VRGCCRRDAELAARVPAAILFSAMRSILLLLSVLALFLGGCTTRSSSAGGLRDQVGKDFAGMDADAFRRSSRQIARVVDRELPDDPEQRRRGPRAVLRVAEATALLVAVLPAADGGELVLLSQVQDSGRVQWRENLALPPGQRLAGVETGSRRSLPVPLLSLQISGEAGGGTLHLALRHDAALPLRFEQGGGLANQDFFAVLPGVEVDEGRLSGDDIADKLAATLYLAHPERAEQRGKPATRSHLKQLATGSADIWLAQAAAAVLTLPAE